MTLLSQVWRLVRVTGLAYGAQVVGTSTHPPKAAVIAGVVGAVETAYRQIVPPKEQSRLANVARAVVRAVRDAASTPTGDAPTTSAGGHTSPAPSTSASAMAQRPSAPVTPHVGP